MSINVRRLKFYFQPNINVETAFINVDDQHCLGLDSTLMYLLGYCYELLLRTLYFLTNSVS